MPIIAVPLDNNNGLDSTVAFRFARAPFFAIIEYENKTIGNISIYNNPHMGGRGGVGIATSQWLASMGVQVVLTPQVGPNAMSALQSFGIQIISVQPGIPLKQALEMYAP